MKVTTNINRMDLIKFNFLLLPRSKSTYISILILSVLIFLFIFWKNGYPVSPIKLFILLIASVVGGIVGSLFGFVTSVINILFMSTKNNGVLGAHEYNVSIEGLYEKTNANESLNKWEGIMQIKVIGSYLLIQITGYLFHIIPRRDFESNERFEQFINYSEQQWKNTRENA